jgi:hypothetical protein
VFGDFDSLAWDLGNPDEGVINDPGPFKSTLLNLITFESLEPIFHPMKGPMATQSPRGMANHGSMYWRGDRTGGNDEPSSQPDSGTFNERAAFKKFQGAFADLLGRHTPIPDHLSPNPNRSLDNSLTAEQQAGLQLLQDTALRLLATSAGHPLTYTCAPPGSGTRMGVDRDQDGAWDGDEEDAGSNPADPASRP